MKKMLRLTIVGMVLLHMQGIAQKVQKCGTEVAIQKILQSNPEFQSVLDKSKASIAQSLQSTSGSLSKTTAQVTVPVVFHIVLTQNDLNFIGGPNRVKTLVDSQMAVINRDFNKINTADDFVPSAFQSVQGNPEIKFVLATKTPQGNPTNGYDIKVTNTSTFSAEFGTAGSGQMCSDAKYNETGGTEGWYLDPNKISYLNVWVVRFTEGEILGIACPPSLTGGNVPKKEAGVCINYRAFGKGGANSLFITGAAGGRTLSHELGHYFNIWHIWGDQAGCGTDDGINDTPLQDVAFSGCPSYPRPNCTDEPHPGGAMFMNFMDYVYDDCYSMFTQQQSTVMRATVVNGAAKELLETPYLTWPTNVAAIETQNFEVYPNPAQSNIYIYAGNSEKIKYITLTDLTGRSVRSINVNNAPITDYNLDVAALPRGIYLLQCTFANGTATKKIVLQ